MTARDAYVSANAADQGTADVIVPRADDRMLSWWSEQCRDVEDLTVDSERNEKMAGLKAADDTLRSGDDHPAVCTKDTRQTVETWINSSQ